MVFSLFFYAWGEPLWVFVLILTALLDYTCARAIETGRGTVMAKLALAMSVTVNLGLLASVKYGAFLVSNLNALLGTSIAVPSFALPLGISFYTFQTLTYVIDVYRGDIKAQRRYPDYLMYLTMYPQLVAGPIVRYSEVAREIEDRVTTPEEAAYGIFRFCVGLGKKVILANTAGKLAGQFLDGNLSALTTAGAWCGVIFFALQIYFDFSGYSDMAIGLGRIFGFHYFENFNYPYISRSVSEFWRRWHISLGAFFRDYIYIPLGGNRRHVYLNYLVVWFLTGLWHGASWNFILWGLWFGLFISLERLFLRKWLERIPRLFSHLYLILVVLIGWVLFYFTDLPSMWTVLGRMFGIGNPGALDSLSVTRLMNYIFFIPAAIIGCLPIAPRIRELLTTKGTRFYAPAALIALEIAVCVILLVVCTAMLVGESYNPFLYFRF